MSSNPDNKKAPCVTHKIVVYPTGTRKRQKLEYRCEKCGHEKK